MFLLKLAQHSLTIQAPERKTIANMSSESTGQNLPVGWIGLGSMGLAMALNVQKHLKVSGLPNLHYWNRTTSKGDDLKAIGGEPCTCAVNVARKCRLTFISVSASSYPRGMY
jgi:3-hydroxyisobutyrate dehydrogenase-like beta-hydroxyacid dehydrogenase